MKNDYPELRLEQLETQLKKVKRIVIREKTISNLAEIIRLADEHKAPIYIQKSTIQGFSIPRGTIVPEDIKLLECTFQGEVYLSASTFKSKVQCDECEFKEEIACAKSTFEKNVYFNKCTFKGEADFTNSSFKKFFLHGCSFRQEATFINTTFEEGFFPNSTFEKKVNFWLSSYQKGAYFNQSTFKGPVDFSMATFENKVNFVESVFEQGTIFKNVIFSKLYFSDMDLSKFTFLNTDLREIDFTNVQWGQTKIGPLGLGEKRNSLYDEEQAERENYPLVEKLYRQLRTNYESRGSYSEAGDFYYGAMEMKRQNHAHFWGRHLSLVAFYKYISGYGEQYTLAFIWLLVILLGFSVIYLFAGLEPARGVSGGLSEGFNYDLTTDIETLTSPELWRDYFDSILYSLKTMTFQRGVSNLEPATRPGMIASAIESILGPFQIALFALALRRRFKR